MASFDAAVPDPPNTLGGIAGDTDPDHPNTTGHIVKRCVCTQARCRPPSVITWGETPPINQCIHPSACELLTPAPRSP